MASPHGLYCTDCAEDQRKMTVAISGTFWLCFSTVEENIDIFHLFLTVNCLKVEK